MLVSNFSPENLALSFKIPNIVSLIHFFQDGDTPLLRAVRIRNAECVQLLLEKKAKVTACDKRGDTALHIAMRARSKTIVEILLRNPRNSQLLYRPNKAGETPYNIDMNHQRTILGQIFGSRKYFFNYFNFWSMQLLKMKILIPPSF